jgi:tetratricopeptide (TPR) repeat protein
MADDNKEPNNSNEKDDNVTNNDTIEDDNDWQVQRDREKTYGDNAFRARDYATAIHHYTAALSLDPHNHILLSNRSAAFLSAQQKSRALHDAQACVEHSPSDYYKGYSRLAAALQSLGRHGPAKEAWETVLKNEPTNAAAKKGLEDALAVLKSQQQQQQQQHSHTSTIARCPFIAA